MPEPVPGAAVELRPIACIRAYEDLIDVLKQEKERLGLSGEECDARAGYADRLTQKLLAGPERPYSRRLGIMTFPTILEVLGVVLLVCRVPPRTEIPPVDQQAFRAKNIEAA